MHTLEQTIQTLIVTGIIGLVVMGISFLVSLYFSHKLKRNDV